MFGCRGVRVEVAPQLVATGILALVPAFLFYMLSLACQDGQLNCWRVKDKL